jgi:ABC-type branched-subunit amino acid transport system ATPase component
MRRPKILLMDEPASGLINTEIDELDLLLRKIADELGIAILLIEHRLELVSAIANKVTVLDLGEIIATDNSDNIFENQAVQEAYFGIDGNKT